MDNIKISNKITTELLNRLVEQSTWLDYIEGHLPQYIKVGRKSVLNPMITNKENFFKYKNILRDDAVVAIESHNLKVSGSNPLPATNIN